MNNQTKITITWAFFALGIMMHTLMEVAESIFFQPLPEEPYNEGVPMFAHVLNILTMIVPMIFAFLTLFLRSKGFIWTSLIYAALLTLLHLFHVIEDGSLENISQLLLLSFMPVVGVLLVITLNKWRKEKTAVINA